MEPDPSAMMLRPLLMAPLGGTVKPVRLPINGALLIGRSDEAGWSIPDPSVSRRHASILGKGGAWHVTDLGSKHGTAVNGERVEARRPMPVQPGDVLSFGGWQCRCTTGFSRHGVTTPFAPAGTDSGNSVSVIPAGSLSGVAQRGLDVILQLTARLAEIGTIEDVAQAAVDAVREATGCRRVVVVELESEDAITVLASTSPDPPRVSRSLIEESARRGLVELAVESRQGGNVPHAHSIVELGIRSAICAPVVIDAAPAAFLMVDTRDAEGNVPPDAAAFCQAVSRLAALALQRVTAADMAERHRQLQHDLEAARRAQELLSPARSGRHGSVEYSFESIPGRIVAGDLFDVFAIDTTSTAFFLGDVAGKGVGAAMLMAACQSQLRTRLLSGLPLARALAEVNADLHARTESSKFITLVAGVLDTQDRRATIADAGHGLVLGMRRGVAVELGAEPGFPLGVVPDAQYSSLEVSLDTIDGLVLFSDGAVEQINADGQQLGREGVTDALAGLEHPSHAVDRLVDSVRAHAAGALTDDLTIAALWIA
ncbi:MAG: SpoIIE family protein phosphatase [Planctomycetota bacterium]